nr:unnamed protein product [Spirometra erinaceieuropaei]
MSAFPLVINGFTAIRLAPEKGTEHFLYVRELSPLKVKVVNVSPFYTKPTIFALFSKFGPINHFRYDKSSTTAIVGYKTPSSVTSLLNTPMNSAYALPVRKASFSHVVAESKKSWLKDPVSLKKQSEQYLQDYFREKLCEDESSEEDDEGWMSTKTKKRRIR